MEIIKIRVEFSKLENIQPNEAINIKILIFWKGQVTKIWACMIKQKVDKLSVAGLKEAKCD
jgi:hypothetical protein